MQNPPHSISLPLSAALVLGTATIAGAWFFQLVLGLEPCPMCLEGRWPYYAGLPILLLCLLFIKMDHKKWAAAGAFVTGALFLGGSVFAIYHSGVEWHFWEGPSECSGGSDLSASVGNLLADLKTARVVSCVDAAWRFLGISLAGYNVIICAIISAFCFMGYTRLKRA